jgi:hypothetical protein
MKKATKKLFTKAPVAPVAKEPIQKSDTARGAKLTLSHCK